MSELIVYDSNGNGSGNCTLPERISSVKATKGLLHQVVRWQRSRRRKGTHNVLTRAEVTGGGVKPWRQKGTGRARSGSNTSSIWVGGGVAHGPKARSYDFKLNKKEKARALFAAVKTRAEEGNLKLITEFQFEAPKTKLAAQFLAAIGIDKGAKALIVVNANSELSEKSFRNLPGVKVIKFEGLNVYDIISAKYLVMPESLLSRIGGSKES